MSGKLILIYVPCGSEDEAATLAKALLERRLVACANIHHSRSLYWWEGKMADETEYILLCKTASSRAEAVESLIRKLHSYDIPCILRLEPTHVNPDYQSWVAGEVSMGALRTNGSPA